MKNREENILLLQRKSASLEPDRVKRNILLGKVLKITERFLEDLKDKPAYSSVNTGTKLLECPFEEYPEDEDKVFEIIEKAVDQPGINPASGKHLGYIPGGGIYTSALGDYWADITNRYAGIYFASPGAVKMENELLRWVMELVGFPKSAGGNITSGGSIANLTAVVTARDAKKIEGDKINKSVIYVTSQTHHCIYKAIRIAGLGNCIIRKVQVTEHLHFSVSDFEAMVKKDVSMGLNPFLVVSSAGTTDSGVIDPFGEISKVCLEFNIWHHVDGAYGAFFLLVKSLKNKLQDIHLADSIVLDPHKSLFLPYGMGIVLVKNVQLLQASFSYEANYMQDALEIEEEISPADVSPELTKPFRGLRLWIPLKIHGLESFRCALQEKHELALYFYEKISKTKGFEAFRSPELSVVMFRYKGRGNSNDLNSRLVRKIHADGRVFLSSTTINGKVWLRVAILVFRTHLDTIDLTLNVLQQLTDEESLSS